MSAEHTNERMNTWGGDRLLPELFPGDQRADNVNGQAHGLPVFPGYKHMILSNFFHFFF